MKITASRVKELIKEEIEKFLLEEKFDFLFKQLKSVNTKESIDKYTTLKRVIIRKRKQEAPLHRDTEGDD